MYGGETRDVGYVKGKEYWDEEVLERKGVEYVSLRHVQGRGYCACERELKNRFTELFGQYAEAPGRRKHYF